MHAREPCCDPVLVTAEKAEAGLAVFGRCGEAQALPHPEESTPSGDQGRWCIDLVGLGVCLCSSPGFIS